ncbi:RUN domain-containing protein [Thermodesulfatator indicus DSM 15286]|uniref:RUN domain-containing protein n=1 Tax=Thermodesulfatator indicus (strain DSM 15286 / JCM 11887 / CIR29812) TaxID=667014 RepID=F8AAN1_THEID|nr:hypothetical protein [Thermodesulfatator indicus]AEH44303.1 RUN domain-containing protein [Thermodesulfatator indicus DSM 15286]
MIKTDEIKKEKIIQEIFGDMDDIFKGEDEEKEAIYEQDHKEKLVPISLIKEEIKKEKISEEEIVQTVKETIDEIEEKIKEIINRKLTKKILVKVLERIE